MPIAINQILRIPDGAPLVFGWTLKPELFDAVTMWNAAFPSWLRRLQGAEVSMDKVERECCVVRLCSPEVCVTAELKYAAHGNLTCHLQAKRDVNGAAEQWSWQREDLSAMLGGKQDAYLAVNGSSGRVPALRMRYDGPIVEVFVLSGAFAHRLPAAIRALVPAELKIGELASPDTIGPAAQRSTPCGCRDRH